MANLKNVNRKFGILITGYTITLLLTTYFSKQVQASLKHLLCTEHGS